MDQALIVMESLSPHGMLRRKLIAGERVGGLPPFGAISGAAGVPGGRAVLLAAQKEADAACCAGNVGIPAITGALVFADPRAFRV